MVPGMGLGMCLRILINYNVCHFIWPAVDGVQSKGLSKMRVNGADVNPG